MKIGKTLAATHSLIAAIVCQPRTIRKPAATGDAAAFAEVSPPAGADFLIHATSNLFVRRVCVLPSQVMLRQEAGDTGELDRGRHINAHHLRLMPLIRTTKILQSG